MFSALSLGIRDYVRKCGFKSVILGLSGGIDSALVAVLAADALGAEMSWAWRCPRVIRASGSLSDAEELAKNLGIRYEVLPIEPVFWRWKNSWKKFSPERKPNEAEENVQSRLRGVTLMALSNKFGALVLTTGNKSEMAVGYCTLYGDMYGALAPLADVFKTDIYKIARWVNREPRNHSGGLDFKAAERRAAAQPDGPGLATALRNFGSGPGRLRRAELSRDEIIRRGFDAAMVSDVLNKVNFSEYKRRQAAPGLKVSPRAFGMGRRIPVAQRFRAMGR